MFLLYHFTDEEAEAQRGWGLFAYDHSPNGLWDETPALSCSKMVLNGKMHC